MLTFMKSNPIKLYASDYNRSILNNIMIREICLTLNTEPGLITIFSYLRIWINFGLALHKIKTCKT